MYLYDGHRNYLMWTVRITIVFSDIDPKLLMNTSQLTSVGFPADYIGDYDLEKMVSSNPRVVQLPVSAKHTEFMDWRPLRDFQYINFCSLVCIHRPFWQKH